MIDVIRNIAYKRLYEASFDAGGKHYVSAFGHYSCDGKPINREEYFGAKEGKSTDAKATPDEDISQESLSTELDMGSYAEIAGTKLKKGKEGPYFYAGDDINNFRRAALNAIDIFKKSHTVKSTNLGKSQTVYYDEQTQESIIVKDTGDSKSWCQSKKLNDKDLAKLGISTDNSDVNKTPQAAPAKKVKDAEPSIKINPTVKGHKIELNTAKDGSIYFSPTEEELSEGYYDKMTDNIEKSISKKYGDVARVRLYKGFGGVIDSDECVVYYSKQSGDAMILGVGGSNTVHVKKLTNDEMEEVRYYYLNPNMLTPKSKPKVKKTPKDTSKRASKPAEEKSFIKSRYSTIEIPGMKAYANQAGSEVNETENGYRFSVGKNGYDAYKESINDYIRSAGVSDHEYDEKNNTHYYFDPNKDYVVEVKSTGEGSGYCEVKKLTLKTAKALRSISFKNERMIFRAANLECKENLRELLGDKQRVNPDLDMDSVGAEINKDPDTSPDTYNPINVSDLIDDAHSRGYNITEEDISSVSRYIQDYTANNDRTPKNLGEVKSALRKLPPYEGTSIYRGLALTANSRLLRSIVKGGLKGSIIDFEDSLTSFTSDPVTAAKFGVDAEPTYDDVEVSGAESKIPVILRCNKNRTGVPVAAMSDYPEEYEVIIPGATKYKCTNVTKKDGYYIVDVDEEDTMSDNKKTNNNETNESITRNSRVFKAPKIAYGTMHINKDKKSSKK